MNFFKKFKYVFLSFILPLIIFIIIFILKGIPNENNFTISDSLAQFLPTYKYLYNILHGYETFPYTFSKGLGGTMYGAFFYGLSSPINLFIYFFKDIELFMLLSTLLKISLSGLSMYIFLRYKKNNNSKSLLFSLAYSLSGYTTLYFINIMWLDSLWLMPLVLIGIEKIIHQKKDFMYISTLLLSLISNYYIGYMMTVFSVIYYIYESYITFNGDNFFKENKKNFSHFVLITFLVGCTIAFILVPVFIESQSFNRAVGEKIFDFNFFNIISGTYIGFGNLNKPLNNHGFIIYCGTAMIPLLLNYFSNKKISKKERKASFLVLMLFLLPIIFKPLSFIWHLFSYPQGFNYRYNFITILFIILLASKSIDNFQINNKYLKYYSIFYIISSLALIYISYEIPEYYIYLNYKNITITLIFFIINCIFIKKNMNKHILKFLPIELILNLTIIFYNSSYVQKGYFETVENYINNEISKYDENYKLANTISYSNNDSLYFKFNSVDIFISSANKNSININYILNGTKIISNHYKYNYSTIISDSILGIKYVGDVNYNSYYDLIAEYEIENKKIYFQQNNYALALVFVASNKIKSLNVDNCANFEFLNGLLGSISGDKSNYFLELNITKIDDYTYEINKDIEYPQIYLVTKEKPLNINNSLIYKHKNYSILYDNTNDNIRLEFGNKINGLKAYALDIKKFKEMIQKINQISLIENNGNSLSFDINTTENGVLLTKIPYEKGWNIKIDSKEVEYYKVLDSLIGIDISKGQHHIEMYYSTPGINTGIIISLLSITLLITYELRKNKFSQL